MMIDILTMGRVSGTGILYNDWDTSYGLHEHGFSNQVHSRKSFHICQCQVAKAKRDHRPLTDCLVKGMVQREKKHPLVPMEMEEVKAKEEKQNHPYLSHALVSAEDQHLHQASAPFQELASQEDAGEALQEMKVQGSASCSGTLPCAWHSS